MSALARNVASDGSTRSGRPWSSQSVSCARSGAALTRTHPCAQLMLVNGPLRKALDMAPREVRDAPCREQGVSPESVAPGR